LQGLREHYIFVCQNRRPEGHPKGCCSRSGSDEILIRLKELIEEREIWNRIRAIGTTCLGLCDQGVVMVVYPDNVWYGNVGLDDVEQIVDEHLVGGNVIERLRLVGNDLS
jgi:(2Fe-2S) ferredoxin